MWALEGNPLRTSDLNHFTFEVEGSPYHSVVYPGGEEGVNGGRVD